MDKPGFQQMADWSIFHKYIYGRDDLGTIRTTLKQANEINWQDFIKIVNKMGVTTTACQIKNEIQQVETGNTFTFYTLAMTMLSDQNELAN